VSGTAGGGSRLERAKDTGRRIATWLIKASRHERLLISLVALLFSLLVGAVILLGSGLLTECREPFLTLAGGTFCYNPVNIYGVMIEGAIGSSFNLAVTLQQTTMLILVGAAVAISFRAGIFNIGTQGQFVLGGLACAAVVPELAPMLPANLVGGVILILLGAGLAMVVGAIYGALPGALLAYYDANEVITTIMLNFIATGFAFAAVREVLRRETGIQTAQIPKYAQLSPVFFPSGVPFTTIALMLAIGVAVGTYLILNNTSFGYDIRVSGLQPPAAEYSGVNAEHLIVGTMAISGAIGGLVGAIFVLMVLGYWQPGVPGIGFDGITVSVLAANNPLGVIPAALLFGVIKSGGIALDLQLGVPRELAETLRGIIILFVAMPESIRLLGLKLGIAEPETAAVEDQNGESE
jgi:simple sugar transport system permease protein